MSFGERLRQRREELSLSRSELAQQLGVTKSAIGNYETGVSFPREEVLLKLFDALQADPNYLYGDSFHGGSALSFTERQLLHHWRTLPAYGQEAVYDLVLSWARGYTPAQREAPRQRIPCYFSPAAAGYASPVLGDDYEYLPPQMPVPDGAEFAVRIQGDSMQPYIMDHAMVFVKREAVHNGDIGIFCVDGETVCKQYYKAGSGTIRLLSLNRARADADLTLSPESERSLVCFGRVIAERVALCIAPEE